MVTFGCEMPAACYQTIFPIPTQLKNRHKANHEGEEGGEEESLA